MALPTKDTVEAGSTPQETAVSQGKSQHAKPASGHLHADAVSLEVPVKVHGSRVIDAHAAAPRTEKFEEQTSTMIVFPQGGVVKMATNVNVGQMLVLTNSKSRQDAICRVVKVRSFPNMQGYVEVEFTHPQSGYWGVYFPSEAPANAHKVAPPPPAAPLEAKPKHELEVSWAPAPAAPPQQDPVPTPTYSKHVKPLGAPAPKPASPFVSIGTQEKIQTTASATAETRTPPSASVHVPPPEPLAAPSAHALEEMLGVSDATFSQSVAAAVESAAENSSASGTEAAAAGTRVFGSFGQAVLTAGDHAAATEAFGARLEAGLGGSDASSSEPRQNWILIAACIAVVFVAVGGGILYFRPKPANTQIAAADSAPARQTVPSGATRDLTSQPAQTAPIETRSVDNARAASAHAAPPSATPTNTVANLSANAAKANKPEPTKQDSQPAASPDKPAAPGVAPEMLASTLNAHPVSSQRTLSQDEAAPSLNSAATSSEPGELPGIGSSSVAPPPPAPEAPVSVGGNVKEPKLISKVLPVYPGAARQARVEGDVVVDTQIDKTGKVAHMKVVSGPMVLRQAALDALRRWKYEPSTLDGQPVSIDMLVTIKFRL
ncbi:MAG TPA: TonB family protein [Candidatus Acidoferrum sp.]|nr:TonB family protein [Candidatus Acidoferrum sp.]